MFWRYYQFVMNVISSTQNRPHRCWCFQLKCSLDNSTCAFRFNADINGFPIGHHPFSLPACRRRRMVCTNELGCLRIGISLAMSRAVRCWGTAGRGNATLTIHPRLGPLWLSPVQDVKETLPRTSFDQHRGALSDRICRSMGTTHSRNPVPGGPEENSPSMEHVH